MKKLLAILLASLTVCSFSAVAASAEGEGTPATGTVYQLTSTMQTKNTNKDKVDLPVFVDGDVIEFGEVTASTTPEKLKTVQIIYHPDAADISSTDSKNPVWKEVFVPRYSLDTKLWDVPEGKKVADLFANSPSFYKTFKSTASFEKGEVAALSVIGLHSADAIGLDIANLERGVAPIDFALENSTFVGWVMSAYTWNPGSTSDDTINLYALWDRGVAPEQTEEDDEEETEESKFAQAMHKVRDALKVAADWINALPSLIVSALSLVFDTGLRNLLYKIFGIEA